MTLRHFVEESEERRERETDHSLSFAALSLLSYVLAVNVGVGVDAGSSVVVALSRTLFRKQVVVVTHTNTGAAKQKRRVYFSLPFLLLPPFFAIFTKFSTNPQSFFQVFIHNCTHTAPLLRIIESNRYRLSLLIVWFLACDADADAHYTALSTKVARQLKLKLFERLQRHSAGKENGRERERERERLGTDRAQCSLMVSASQLLAHTHTCIHTLAHLYVF